MAIDYKKLNVWQDSHKLTIELLKFLEKNDLNKNFRLKDQIQGSVISIGSNIAESSLCESKLDMKRFLSYALKSGKELEYQILILKDMDYISLDTYTHFQKQLDKIIGSLVNYSRKITQND